MGLPITKEQNSQYNDKQKLQLSACIILPSSKDVLDGMIMRKMRPTCTGSNS